MTVGSDAEFVAFVAARQAALVRLGWALTGDRQLGEDLAQAAFDRLWPRWRRIAAEGDPWPYLQRIAVNLATTWWRRRYRHLEVLTDSVPERVAAGDPASADLRAVVAGWLPTLPPGQRASVVLRFMCDLSVAETAEIMCCSAGTVKSQTTRALNALRARASEAGEN
jgi:RNA polymerase sigma-70 factor (sigma-E family)